MIKPHKRAVQHAAQYLEWCAVSFEEQAKLDGSPEEQEGFLASAATARRHASRLRTVADYTGGVLMPAEN